MDANNHQGTIKETFSLAEVPREAYYMGLAGTLPYLATSISTVYLSWELNHSTAGYGMIFSQKDATYLLSLIEPLQIGYGASILSFLGAIHWGLEWAGYGGTQGYKRYAIGVVAPMVAWSTLLMPIEGALISQFLGFVGLYYVDTRTSFSLLSSPFSLLPPPILINYTNTTHRRKPPWLDSQLVRRIPLRPHCHRRSQYRPHSHLPQRASGTYPWSC